MLPVVTVTDTPFISTWYIRIAYYTNLLESQLLEKLSWGNKHSLYNNSKPLLNSIDGYYQRLLISNVITFFKWFQAIIILSKCKLIMDNFKFTFTCRTTADTKIASN